MSIELPTINYNPQILSAFSYNSHSPRSSQDNSPSNYSSNSHIRNKVRKNKQSLLISMFKSKKSQFFNNLAANNFPVPSLKRNSSVPYKTSQDTIVSTDDESRYLEDSGCESPL